MDILKLAPIDHVRILAVMVGKKNIECRVLAINKGEIVKRIMYQNPDADFLFCVGDDKVSKIAKKQQLTDCAYEIDLSPVD
jgi:trehalose-6-phosphatase